MRPLRGTVATGLALVGFASAIIVAAPAGPADVASEMEPRPLPRTAPDPGENPATPDKVALGRLLFFDPVLSSSRDVSCATCHDPRHGWADSRPTPIGVGGSGAGPGRVFTGSAPGPLLPRNTPTLLDVGFNGLVSGTGPDPSKAPMFWDSRVAGLERQVPVPLRTPGEMCAGPCDGDDAMDGAVRRVRAIPGYREKFRAAFGGSDAEAVDATRLARAIAAFERSLVARPTPVDRFLAGDTAALDAAQRQGLRVFRDAGCIHCHGGPMFSDFKAHVVDVAGASGSRSGPRAFRTPSLRNLRHTAPYMHDGRLRTLRDVLVFYDDLAEAVSETSDGGVAAGHVPLDPLLARLRLSPDDFPALEAFLDALSTDAFDRTIPASVPSGLPVLGAR
ncbi:MAG: cytochrome c peroxidase [Verrucomicrobiota bacterium]